MKRASYRFTLLSLAAFFLLTFSFFASASEPIYATKEPVEIYHPFYVGAFGAFVIPDDMKIGNSSEKIQFDNSWAAGAKTGYVLPVQWLAAEVEYVYLADQDVDKPGTGQFSANNLMANLLLRYPKGMIRPYIGGGIGWSFADFRGSANNFGWQALAGINLEILPNLSMDIAYRFFTSDYEFDHLDVTAEDHMILAGLNYHFGGVAPVPPPKEEPPPVVQEADSDGDGVVDSKDKCPNTLQGCLSIAMVVPWILIKTAFAMARIYVPVLRRVVLWIKMDVPLIPIKTAYATAKTNVPIRLRIVQLTKMVVHWIPIKMV